LNIKHTTMTLQELITESKELTIEGAARLVQAKRHLITARDEHKDHLTAQGSYQDIEGLIKDLETILDLF